ncbi:MAG TPA: acyltransferase [Baekduia sp.]|nr:acyltransferase [Baekduia sp.]
MCAAHRRSERGSSEDVAGNATVSATTRAAVAPPAALPRAPGWRDRRRLARAQRRGVVVEGAWSSFVVGRDVIFDVARGGRLVLHAGVVLGDRCRLHVGDGATVEIGAGTRLGERCVVTAHEHVTLGAGCLLADEVVLVDGDPRFDDVERPVREQGVVTAPVKVGDGVRIGPGAAVLRGVTVGDGASVGALAVLTQDVAAGAVVDGVPATPPAARPRAGGGGTESGHPPSADRPTPTHPG